MTRVEHTTDAPARLAQALRDRPRVLLVTTSRRFVDPIRDALPDHTVDVFDRARVHVPAEVVRAAAEKLEAAPPDAIVTVGGGAATGLGKMLRLERDPAPYFVAIPTTYAGSEMTNIWGTTEGGTKRTGRDDRVAPDLVLYDPAFSRTLPPRLTTQSLFNALAHPISALTAGLEPDAEREALDAIRTIASALTQLAESPAHAEARAEALRGAALAGRVLNRGTLGEHHALAHRLGGRFDLEHAALHAVLLPSTLHRLRHEDPETFARVEAAAGLVDLPRQLFDLLRRADAPTSLRDLGVAALPEDAPEALFAHEGRRPVRTTRFEDWGLRRLVSVDGDLSRAKTIVVGVHGRSVAADAIVRMAREIGGHDFTVVAPQAPNGAWYDDSYRTPFDSIAPLPTALEEIERTIARCREANPAARLVLFGFSQGACLALEALARSEARVDAVVAINGARIGPRDAYSAPRVTRTIPILVGVAAQDRWVDTEDVDATAACFGDHVERIHAPGDAHEIDARQRLRAAELIQDRSLRSGQRGFGNAHETEALAGAVPRRANSPRRVRYGLYAEQINGTGFVAERHKNLRTWTYRVRPTAQHTRFAPLDHSGVTADFDAPPDPNLAGWAPLPPPDAPRDFVDGLVTFGGAGRPETRRGFAVHLYVANRSMNHRAFANADGDLLVVPQRGALTLLTELGVLECAPGSIAVLPRGIRFSVLVDDFARGYVAEVYGRHFELPSRGPVGANGLTDPRHFVAPTAYYEDRLDPGYRIVHKFGGRLFEAQQDYSPHDVVGWHGDYSPYVYDLMDFSPVSAARFDHPDPSIFTVLSCPLDEPGANLLDLVFFPPRWDVGEDTFRPPFFHRNATTEINGIIKDPGGDHAPFYAGGCFVTPSVTPHGVRNRAVHRIFTSPRSDAPRRTSEASMWFQFESALPLTLTRWAASTRSRIQDWPDIWGAYRTFFDPADEMSDPPGRLGP